MAKRGLKRGRVTLAAVPLVHDRRATELVHQDVVAEEVDDPYEPGATILVMRSLRHDPIAAMWKKGHIDECQYRAGREWQKAYEFAEIGGARAIDYTRDKVDGGQIAQPTVSDKQARAIADLTKSAKALGDYGSSIVYDVLACHMTIAQTANRRMMTSEAELKFIGRRFRECLDTIAIVFGLATKAT
jgi:hypothetical protein